MPIVVPFSKAQAAAPDRGPPPDENFVLMAAGMMKKEQEQQIYDESKRSDEWKKGEWSSTWRQAVTPDNKGEIPKDWESIEEDGMIFSRPKIEKKHAQEDLIS